MSPSYILIKGAIIIPQSALTSRPPDTTNITTINAQNHIITPGFTNSHHHHHLWQHPLRALATDFSLYDYCVHLRSTYGSLYTPDDVYFSNYAAALSLINNGVTSVLDHCHVINSPAHADNAVRGLKDAGIRGGGRFVMGFGGGAGGGFDQRAREEDAVRVRDEYFRDNDPRSALLTFGIAPNEPDAQPIDKTIRELQKSRAIGARLITLHIALGHYDIFHQRTVQQLADANLLAPDLLGAIQASGAGIVSTPDTEMQMGMGNPGPVVWRAGDGGCRVGLGLDIASNQGCDVLAQMRLVLQMQRALENAKPNPNSNEEKESGPPIKLTRKTMDILRIATLGGAQVLQLDQLTGSITPGKKADLVIFRCDDIDTTLIVDPVGTVVFHASVKQIDTVLIDGRLVGVDWLGLRGELEGRSERLRREAGGCGY
ncbi:uncharacterized protein ASPGLDRAFT_71924 [Aspergillus glaucus CBS 516.65]|uniref:Amidohydrolase-related domain-containing protein n=1 Tax=Aspergillus glaucus CBS 516.65 TaxID=1160497 RepID=A0A1L9VUW8_ASPGL|nr:hypothetical protein ASPGLDRAFT_71924 [Aspergillus glaucus CBS 516.65]OJJ87686.1 hypothetical protein ASPGLDRAFT_71924 [Aspergillus glaucus CBS 516.65]